MRTKENFKTFIVVVLLFILCVIALSSCTQRLQGSHGERLHSNAAYRSLYYHPYRNHSKMWYDKHQIYWFYRPEAHPTDCKPTPKHYNWRYVYG
jgi:hypothetical protein